MLATKKPTVCSSLNSITELLDSSEVIFVAPDHEEELADAVIDLFANPLKSAEVGRNGRLACERLFSADHINIQQVLSELIHERA